MSSFKKIVNFAKPYKKYAFLNIFFNVLYAVFNVLSVLAFIPVLGILFGKEEIVTSQPSYSGITSIYDYVQGSLNYKISQMIESGGSEKALLFVSLTTLFLFFFKNLFRYLASYTLVFLQTNTIKDIQSSMFAKYISLPISFFSEKRKGDAIARITSDVHTIQFTYLSSFETIVREPLTIVFTLISMFAISVKLTLFVFLLLPISGFIISTASKKLKASSSNFQKENGYFLSIVDEALGGLKIIKSFTAERAINSKVGKSINNLFGLMTSLKHRQMIASPLSEFLGTVTIVAILWFGGKLVLANNSTLQPQEFFGYIGLFYLILNPAKAISTAMYGIQQGSASADRIFEILETKNPIEDTVNAIDKTSFDTEIEFKNISFKYQDDYVLQNFSLKIPKGKTVALVGQSGSGKSTLANLITRFYDVDSGEILIDGINIKNIKKESLRDLMGMVTQDSILFNDSVKNNILLGKENTTEEEVIKASNVANAHEFIKNLPSKYDTNIGDGGNMLSGGQKQRLSIARAVLKNPPIMILDEATSALDTESEQLVQQALDKMMEHRTSLVIAHRLSTIQKADNIVVLRKGKIVEQGKHEELLDRNGEYFKLVSMQSLG
ncbi:ABC transporter ATP-binding protein [Tenacibaculum sp. SSH1-16]|uniref:ABC transporter ATP-binding protein n=1 Tax=Tenacibaculum sp. SSH1-16 TaxID=3136667 RepID=UPI0012E6852E|nr:ABC transporter ATP-binding protein [Tenacibaculum mesophilum]BFF41132.1 ABC transporter ATP-binding protein [Tenacibaculum mesophilum]GFD75109.1 antibiotic ABC transporter ATP-binding protein [Tenacibaculum sp. KUL113]GFD82125.1 antibiotic ABC transporter ATP-binding protein [Tenacibaculum sp. KUL118]